MTIDLGSIVAICLLVALVILGFRANRAPGNDRSLVKAHARLNSRVAVLEAGIKSCATAADVATLSGKIDSLEEHAASSGDINALEGKVNVLQAETAATRQSAELTRQGVARLEYFFIQKGIER
ncbi:hypothetical protein [Sphingobium yanoikuyae]|uniref:hypothetical protein n=1 Tax=Sphingobium yanoikuyae TaxID=13690 RepID=UPI0026EA8220|nr:hypothetical protein [Sphingobium yanoikuyae]